MSMCQARVAAAKFSYSSNFISDLHTPQCLPNGDFNPQQVSILTTFNKPSNLEFQQTNVTRKVHG